MTVTPAERNAAVIHLRGLLDFRLPASGSPLTTIVLPRSVAEALMEEIAALRGLDESPRDGFSPASS